VTRHNKDQRKERVLHTRVSEKLDEELREKAAGLGVSVSNLVRNILLNTVEMVEDIVADSGSVMRATSKGKRKVGDRPGANDDNDAAAGDERIIVGWQELTLHINALCSHCNAILPKGGIAAMAVVVGSAPPVFRCRDCVPNANEGTPETES
jgi:hypothetical protein